MSETTIKWHAIGEINDVPLRGTRTVNHGDMKIAIFRTAENKIFALQDKCPHSDGPLSEGIVHDNSVTCPLHYWVISLDTGKAQGADKGCTLTFPIKLEGEKIFISLTPNNGAST